MRWLIWILALVLAYGFCRAVPAADGPVKKSANKKPTPYDKAAEIDDRARETIREIWASFEAAKGVEKVDIALFISRRFAVNARQRLQLLEFLRKAQSEAWPDPKAKNTVGYYVPQVMALLGDHEGDLKVLKLFAELGALVGKFPYAPVAGQAKVYIDDRGGVAYLVRLLESDKLELRKLAWSFLVDSTLNGGKTIKGKYEYDPAKSAKDQTKVLDQLRKLALETKD